MIQERVIVLGRRQSLAGVLSEPTSTAIAPDLVLVLLNAGLIHRAGPSRVYVRIARALAQRGIAALRLDLSNIGDSLPRADNLPLLESIVRDPQEVMDDLEGLGYRRFILAGICSGAYSAFKTAVRDARVVGTGLLNPQDFIGDENWISYAWAQRYWKKSLFSPRAWLNLLSGRVDYLRLFNVLSKQLVNLLGSGGGQVAAATQGLRAEIDALLERGVELLLVFSSRDVSVEQFSLLIEQGSGTEERPGRIHRIVLPDADHLFGRAVDQSKLVDEVSRWVCAIANRAALPQSAPSARFSECA